MWIREGKGQGGNVTAVGQDYRTTFPLDWHLSSALCLKPLGHSSPGISRIICG